MRIETQFTSDQISRIIEMAWEDRTPFEAIQFNFGLNESAVIRLMRSQIKPSSFRLWRKRVTNAIPNIYLSVRLKYPEPIAQLNTKIDNSAYV